jgi:hypothetical protein
MFKYKDQADFRKTDCLIDKLTHNTIRYACQVISFGILKLKQTKKTLRFLGYYQIKQRQE